jgi:hypothetical protein
VGEVYKYYDMATVEEVEKTSLEWPESEKRPEERWPKHRSLDGTSEESDSEGKLSSLVCIKGLCS